MKNSCIIFLMLFIISVTALGFSGVLDGGASASIQTKEYLRIHIRANSNEEAEQAVKYLVRDCVVEYLTPVIAECNSVEKAQAELQRRLSAIAQLSSAVLRENGFSYDASAKLVCEQFPTRVYDAFVLPQGEYMALVVELGSGQGDNWWCVAYPPLCFTATKNVVYKSKIVEIITRWKNDLS